MKVLALLSLMLMLYGLARILLPNHHVEDNPRLFGRYVTAFAIGVFLIPIALLAEGTS